MVEDDSYHFCPYCEQYGRHMKMTDDGWKCENCSREWKDGASFRRIFMAKREKENGSQSNARGH